MPLFLRVGATWLKPGAVAKALASVGPSGPALVYLDLDLIVMNPSVDYFQRLILDHSDANANADLILTDHSESAVASRQRLRCCASFSCVYPLLSASLRR